ncbi:hypothetical protein KGR20_23135 [Cytobacillus oceanisediminis]|uniref:hypothetical protein n=1 Tax=Cytobacillus oceanisediminis TaxID=665099 RepID=UPI001CCA8A63|nr:hypothetical protein [Cytobacillus oceanisediminis]MBZ9537057.1 hypothetical protein [Cytobacillus oceanisediminis]
MKCCYPNCNQDASSTWALVPLCVHHHKSIEEETGKYYHRNSHERIPYDQRENYLNISSQIPWSKKEW